MYSVNITQHRTANETFANDEQAGAIQRYPAARGKATTLPIDDELAIRETNNASHLRIQLPNNANTILPQNIGIVIPNSRFATATANRAAFRCLTFIEGKESDPKPAKIGVRQQYEADYDC